MSKKIKSKVFYVKPIGGHTNKAIAELIEGKTSDSTSYDKKVCGTSLSANVFRVNKEDLRMIIESSRSCNLSYELFRDTVYGLVYLIDVEYWAGSPSPYVMAQKRSKSAKVKKAERDLYNALERLNRKKSLIKI